MVLTWCRSDEVSVNINVETRNLTLSDAQEQNKIISENLLVELVKAGFDRNNLKFVNIYSYPEYDWNDGTQKFKGYVVSQQLVVKTAETDKVPEIVDSAIKAGALVSYINFELSDAKEKEYRIQALKEASADAKDKAGAIAAGQGKSLGGLVKVVNQEFNYRPWVYYESASMGGDAKVAAMNIAPNEQEITASIVAEYKLSRF